MWDVCENKKLPGAATRKVMKTSDGIVHHVVVEIGHLVIDARGVNTRESLVNEINREADLYRDPLRAVEIIPFEFEHGRLLKTCEEKELRVLRACLNIPAMHDVRRQIKRYGGRAFRR